MTDTRGWLHDGTGLVVVEIEADLDAPSLLPEWDRRHVAAHLARNAEAIGRLLDWARTGVETPMYPSAEARNADIERSAQAAPDAIRADVRDTAAALARVIEDMPGPAWQREVRNSRGLAITGADVLWMRACEVWIHAADLGGGVTFAQFPPALCERLVDQVTGSASEPWPALRLTASDTGRAWTVGVDGVAVEAPTHELAAWLTGRATRAEVELPSWL